MVELVIDNREKKLIDLFKKNDSINIEIKQLELGDIHVVFDNNTVFIIERKTIQDLLSSLTDGRYREQKIRVLSSLKNDTKYCNCKYIYLIEGSIEGYNEQIKKKYYGTLISLQLRDKIIIFKTDNVKESYNFLTRLKFRIENKNDFISLTNNQSDETQNNQYLNTIKSKKKDNITPTNCQILFLTVIPGISVNIATKIIENYTTINKLIESYNKCLSKEDQEIMLKDIQITTKRKLGKVLSKKINNYLII